MLLSKLQAKLKMLNNICDIEDDIIHNINEDNLDTAKDLFNFIWSELQEVEKLMQELNE